MASTLNTIKNRIRDILEVLRREDTLREVQVDDFRSSLSNRNIAAFPAAILTTPTIESVSETNVHNTRTYTFTIAIVSRAEDVSDPAQIEDLIETVLNKFDDDPMLKAEESTGVADAGVLPSTSTPEAVTDGGRSYVIFYVILRVRATRQLTYV